MLNPGDKVLASSPEGPVWVMSQRGPMKHYRSAFALPVVRALETLSDVLNSDSFLELVPLLHWLRDLCASSLYKGPPLRACFIVDDPNLHWPRYGSIDFRQIADRAAKGEYHVSFATIPLDAWFTHQAAAKVFRSNPDRLSLCVHGNNHTKEELARDWTPAQRASLLRQAIRRIERLESCSGLQVARVMVPPHGACVEETLSLLPGCGFEAACVSHGSLQAHNRGKSWTKKLGYLQSELVSGCPILPRWGFSGQVENRILVAAFLNQPIVLRGHQRDLREGVELLDELARFINGLGPVSWLKLDELSRINYQWTIIGETLFLKPFSRILHVRLPPEAALLLIQDPADPSWRTWRISGHVSVESDVCNGHPVRWGAVRGGSCAIELTPTPPLVGSSRGTLIEPWPLIRRLFAEGRDRFLPL
jgi:hypothetical protein